MRSSAEVRRRSGRAAGEPQTRNRAAASRNERDRRVAPLHRAQQAGARRELRLLSARLLHHEVQSAHRRRGGGDGGLYERPSARAEIHGSRLARGARHAARGSLRDHRHGRHDLPARGGRARRVHRRAFNQAVSRFAQRYEALQDHRAGFRARNEPRDCGDVRLSGREHPLRAERLRRPRSAQERSRRRRCGSDAHEPEHGRHL